jgi:acyl-CoA thioester hydrolase
MTNLTTPPEGFHHATPFTLRFRDLDVLGHLNNVVYLTYMEQARIKYVHEVCAWNGKDWNTLGMILAKTTIEYLLPVLYRDDVMIYTRVSRLGGKSFDMEYIMLRQQADAAAEVAARATTVMVAYNYQQGSTVPIPQMWRERILAYEPAAPQVT